MGEKRVGKGVFQGGRKKGIKRGRGEGGKEGREKERRVKTKKGARDKIYANRQRAQCSGISFLQVSPPAKVHITFQ